MDNNVMILAQDQYYSLDCHKTQLNNNVLVVGTSGAGKTRSIVAPNILQATGSYVISDPKGNLYEKYSDYLTGKGYKVKKLDFTDPYHSAHYNMFKYVNTELDIMNIAGVLVGRTKNSRSYDPFWDEMSDVLLQSLIGYMFETEKRSNCTMERLINLLVSMNGINSDEKSELDWNMERLDMINRNSIATRKYKMFRVGASRTIKSVVISANSKVGRFYSPELNYMMGSDDINLPSIGQEKTALFVVVSDTDRSMDKLANIFFTQAMNQLCRYADKECKDSCLPVPVRFILDDFATNCYIEQFPRMISSFRSRNISTMLMIQAESQLKEYYGEDGRTIIGNCDTYVYLGGNDIETAKEVSVRSDVPLKKILNMPIGTNWIFRRGQAPVNAKNFDLDSFLREKKVGKKEFVLMEEKAC